jgi:hypothetical protein
LWHSKQQKCCHTGATDYKIVKIGVLLFLLIALILQLDLDFDIDLFYPKEAAASHPLSELTPNTMSPRLGLAKISFVFHKRYMPCKLFAYPQLMND